MIDPAALPPRAARRTRVVRLRGDAVLLILVGAAVAWLALAPLGYLLWRAFVEDGSLTSRYLREAFGVVGLGRVLGDTAIFAAGSTALGLALGAALAFLLGGRLLRSTVFEVLP